MKKSFFYRNPNVSEGAGGPLAGMAVALQSNIAVAGWPMEAGSEALNGFKALEDATVVERLRRNGAVISGLTHTSEFGFGINGSSGAGRAVEQKEADAEIMLDLAGEARLAAERAGLWGFKPSWGLIPRLGIAGLIPSMEVCGILAKTPGDIRAVVKGVAGADERDFSQPDLDFSDVPLKDLDSKKMTLGVIEESLSALSASERSAFDGELDGLGQLGFIVKSFSWPDYALCLVVHKIVGSVEASSAAGRYDSVRFGKRVPGAKNWNDMYLQCRGASFGTLVKSYLMQGAYFQFERYDAYEKACRIRARLVKDARRLERQADALIFPVQNTALIDTSEALGHLYEQCIHTVHANVAGWPSLTAPASAPDRPGLQIVGALQADARLIALGDYLYQQRRGGK